MKVRTFPIRTLMTWMRTILCSLPVEATSAELNCWRSGGLGTNSTERFFWGAVVAGGLEKGVFPEPAYAREAVEYTRSDAKTLCQCNCQLA